MADVFNFLFDIERDGYFLPNGTRLNQLDSFDEQRKMTGCNWSEFFEKMYHEHHHVMDRSGHTPDKTFQIFYTRTLNESAFYYFDKVAEDRYRFNWKDKKFDIKFKSLYDLKEDENNFYVINLFGSEQFMFANEGPQVCNLKETFSTTQTITLNPIVYEKLKNTNLKLVIITFHEGGVMYDEFYQKLYNSIKLSNLDPKKVWYINANASNVENHDRWCIKNNIKEEDKINVRFTNWLFGLATMNYGSKNLAWNIISHTEKRNFNYLILNRSVFKDHRMWVLASMDRLGLLEKSLYSIIFPYDRPFEYRIDNVTGFGTFATKENYDNVLPYLKKIKALGNVKLDDFPTTKRFNYDDIDPFTETFEPYYADTYLSVVTETTFNVTQISEKIAKPLRYRHPFIVISGPGYLKALRDMGFKTFGKYFDESYDEELDDVIRMQKIMDLLVELNDSNKLEQIYKDAQQEIEYNSKLCESMNVRNSLQDLFHMFLYNGSN